MEISGSASSIADLATAMSQSRLQNEMSIKMLKKGLDTQAAAAVDLLRTAAESSPPPAKGAGGSGQLVDVLA